MSDITFNFPAEKTDEGGQQYLTKDDLVGELIVAETSAYNPSAVTTMSPDGTHEWRGNILVVTGTHKGRYQEDQKFWSNIAKQLGQIPVGEKGICRVVSGTSKNGRGRWFGVDRIRADQTDEIKAAQDAVAAHQESGDFPF